jgi:phospholipid/cholesterol/gamma-HCH transport system substrate-binding protein
VIADTEVRSERADLHRYPRGAGNPGADGIGLYRAAGRHAEQSQHPEQAIADNVVAVIEADPSGVTNLLATADEILNRANRVIGEVESFVQDARSPLTETLKNAETFSAALSENADGIDEFLKSVRRFRARCSPCQSNLRARSGRRNA